MKTPLRIATAIAMTLGAFSASASVDDAVYFENQVALENAIALESNFAPELMAPLAGNWKMTSAQCIKGSSSRPPKYDASIDLRLGNRDFTAIGRVGTFSCQIQGVYTYSGNSISYRVTNDGGCPLGSYLNGGFQASVQGNHMTVFLGTNIGNTVCDVSGSTVRVNLVKR